eukprot:8779254-Pyramimonas_sp.AAC.1
MRRGIRARSRDRRDARAGTGVTRSQLGTGEFKVSNAGEVFYGLTEGEGGAEGHAPAEGNVGGVAGVVLVHGEGGVDARAVHLLALLIQPAHGGAARRKKTPANHQACPNPGTNNEKVRSIA